MGKILVAVATPSNVDLQSGVKKARYAQLTIVCTHAQKHMYVYTQAYIGTHCDSVYVNLRHKQSYWTGHQSSARPSAGWQLGLLGAESTDTSVFTLWKSIEPCTAFNIFCVACKICRCCIYACVYVPVFLCMCANHVSSYLVTGHLVSALYQVSVYEPLTFGVEV